MSTGDGSYQVEKLEISDLVTLFENSENSSYNMRVAAERDRDYYDNIQYTAEELEAFKKRKQPPIIINRIKRKIDFLKGYEVQQRVKPRVLPRTPLHEMDADGAEQALQFVAEDQRFNFKRSRVWDNLIIEGMAGYRVGVKQNKNGDFDIELNVVPWDRIFFDPHSAQPDFSDGKYIGAVRWMDYDDALLMYPEGEDALQATINFSSNSTTYDDRPKYRMWADRKRKRVRIAQIWIKKGEQWWFAEYTKGGILKSGPSPYVDDAGESDCELVFGSAYVNRLNDRYGLVREMIGPQDEINKRRSKALHLLNTNQVIAEEGAVRDVEKARREMARPDGWIDISPGYTDKINVQTRTDLANGHMQLLQEAKTEIDMIGGNIALQGGAAQDAASGKAIVASQQGGVLEISPVLDALRDLDIRVYRKIWSRIRQFWTQEKWVRVTDDQRNVKWLGLNVDPTQIAMAAANDPSIANRVSGVVQNVAQLDVDIILEDAPDSLTNQMEQFQALVQLKQVDAGNELPFKALLEAMPNLKNKDRIISEMEQAAQAAANNPNMLQQNQILLAKAQSEIDEKNASAGLKDAQTQKTLIEAHLAPEKVANDRYKEFSAPMQMQRVG